MRFDQMIQYRVRNLNEGKRFVQDLVLGRVPEIDTRDYTLRAICMYVSLSIEHTKTGFTELPKVKPSLCGAKGDRCSRTKYGDRLYDHAFRSIVTKGVSNGDRNC